MPVQYNENLNLAKLVADYNSLEKSKELLQEDYDKQSAEIQTIKSKQEAEHQKTIQEYYIRKDDEKAITEIAKISGMLSKAQDIKKELGLDKNASSEQIVARIIELKSNSATNSSEESAQASDESRRVSAEQLDNLNNQLNSLQTQKTNLQNNYNSEKQAKEQAQKSLTTLTADHEKLNAEIKAKNESIQTLTGEKSQLEGQKNTLQQQFDNLQLEHDKTQLNLQIVQRELGEVRAELLVKDDEIKNLTAKNALKIQGLESSLTDKDTELAGVKSNSENITQRIQELEEQITSIQEAKDELQKQIEVLQGEKETLTNNLESKTQAYETLRSSLSGNQQTSQNTIDQLTNDLKTLRTNLEDEQKNHLQTKEILEQQIVYLTTEKNARPEISKADWDNDYSQRPTQNQLENVENQVQAYQIGLKTKLDLTDQTLSTWQTEIDSLKTRPATDLTLQAISDLQRDYGVSQNELREAKTTINRLEGEIATLTGQVNDKQEELNNLTAELAEANKTIEELAKRPDISAEDFALLQAGNEGVADLTNQRNSLQNDLNARIAELAEAQAKIIQAETFGLTEWADLTTQTESKTLAELKDDLMKAWQNLAKEKQAHQVTKKALQDAKIAPSNDNLQQEISSLKKTLVTIAEELGLNKDSDYEKIINEIKNLRGQPSGDDDNIKTENDRLRAENTLLKEENKKHEERLKLSKESLRDSGIELSDDDKSKLININSIESFEKFRNQITKSKFEKAKDESNNRLKLVAGSSVLTVSSLIVAGWSLFRKRKGNFVPTSPVHSASKKNRKKLKMNSER